MALDELLTVAARITWRRRSWWVLGLLATSGGLLANLFFRGLSWYLPGVLSVEKLDLQRDLGLVATPGGLIAGVTGAFVIGLVLWAVGAVVEGGLIVAVNDRAEYESTGVRAALRAGLGLLGRFIGIDTLLFLPLFLLALALMVIGFAGLAGLIVVVARPSAQVMDLLLVAGATTLFSVPILLLMLALGAAIIVLRSLAFRAAALEALSATDSIRRAWRLLRDQLFSVSALALVLWAIRSLVGTPLRMITILVAGLSWAMAWTGTGLNDSGLSVLLAVGGLFLAILTWLVNGIMNVYGSTSWTMAFEKWTAEPV